MNKSRKLSLHRETVRSLSDSNLSRVRGGETDHTLIAACISAKGSCGTWGESDCSRCLLA
jgi:natural product precursor